MEYGNIKITLITDVKRRLIEKKMNKKKLKRFFKYSRLDTIIAFLTKKLL
ncbi:MAG: hypothetical protein IJJ59_03810 [Pseudobutyrivibrio sp.]|nr:hypothetical protein [Pseudobutyrivibrio sp.]MBQ6462431.1 hypothetical protein [Pseudobutyrivibrio sp.]MBQ7470279.1 hypothetical protein [Pseudobutyrivibrio sp.]